MKSIEYLKSYYERNFLINSVIPEIISSIKDDKVPNVKFCSCQNLCSLSNYLKDSETKEKVKEHIQKYVEDKDDDVKFFSNKALNTLL